MLVHNTNRDELARNVDDADTLKAFGNKSKPRDPRAARDIDVDKNGMVYPGDGEWPDGASTFGDVNQAPLTGHYHEIPKDVDLPEGLKITPDGSDVGGPRGPTHHTISPTEPMTLDEFVEKFQSLPWKYGGKK